MVPLKTTPGLISNRKYGKTPVIPIKLKIKSTSLVPWLPWQGISSTYMNWCLTQKRLKWFFENHMQLSPAPFGTARFDLACFSAAAHLGQLQKAALAQGVSDIVGKTSHCCSTTPARKKVTLSTICLPFLNKPEDGGLVSYSTVPFNLLHSLGSLLIVLLIYLYSYWLAKEQQGELSTLTQKYLHQFLCRLQFKLNLHAMTGNLISVTQERKFHFLKTLGLILVAAALCPVWLGDSYLSSMSWTILSLQQDLQITARAILVNRPIKTICLVDFYNVLEIKHFSSNAVLVNYIWLKVRTRAELKWSKSFITGFSNIWGFKLLQYHDTLPSLCFQRPHRSKIPSL